MTYRDVAEQLARVFRQNPLDYVAEADLQATLVQMLRAQLSPEQAIVSSELTGGSDTSFKREYWQTAQQRLAETGQLNRVHTEVSVRKGERLDVVVFQDEIAHPIEWVSGGSKRFSSADVDCAIELKFVKNKTSFPKQSGYRVTELADRNLSQEALAERVGTDESILDVDENKLRDDLEELNSLAGIRDRLLLLFSNNNYLYHDPTDTESTEYRYGELYHTMGQAARQWLQTKIVNDVDILYVHPRGSVWLSQ